MTEPATAALDGDDSYERRKERERNRQSEQSRKGRDIGEIPAVVNPARKAACERNFRLYCESYFPHTFALGWSEDHLKVIGQIEASVLEGGLFATAMPRGSGKTSLAEVACCWAVSYGHRAFVALIGSDEDAAKLMLASIKTEFEVNELLAEDFPEICYPIEKLDGIANRAAGQHHKGERTHIGWKDNELILPTVAGSKASGAIVKARGITGRLRGMKHKRPDGKAVRPELVVIDDPQTDQSARSPSQCETRERILAGAILGLAGPGKKISGIMPTTVIRAGDMSDRILSRELHPEWNGTRTKMVYAWPTAEKLWEEYGRIRADGLRAGDGGRAATEFYAANREAMDAGSRVAWEARHNPDELSAIQHAMNLRLDRGDRAFFAEFQNDPLPEAESRGDDLTPDQITARVNGTDRGTVPISCTRLTAFIDVQASLLYWAVVAWEDGFTGAVVDYGTFPDQQRAYFTLRDAKRTLSDAVKGAGLEGQIYGGLEALCDAILGREWRRGDESALKVERCLIDANWGLSTAVVRRFCRQSSHSAVLTPSHGKAIGAASMPMGDWQKRPGDRHGHNWVVRSLAEDRKVRSVTYDTNYWKSFLLTRLSTAMGDPGAMTLFGQKPHVHQLLADHLTAEFRVRTAGRGREIDEWKIRPERPDNHWLDGLVGCCVAASMQGVSLTETQAAPAAKRERVSFAELKRRAAERRQQKGA